jgi:hypothetical protein
MTKKLNYKITNIRLDKETFDLVSEISKDLKIPNTEIVRLLLLNKCREIKSMGLENFELVISGKVKSMTK